jgi:DNA-directed RNA polymerase specialized sigma24 family protein
VNSLLTPCAFSRRAISRPPWNVYTHEHAGPEQALSVAAPAVRRAADRAHPPRQHAAFETLFSRYQSRLLSFCRHMLSSREDAEDVLQEVFAAAFNAILADEREINVRPWLYRIARNRSLNHLRRASAIGVDSMDVHFADHGPLDR